MMVDYLIQVENLSVKMGNRYLLENINWRVKPGEHWVVFGMNGSGKTTLLSVISGFQHFTEGSLAVFGKAYSNDNILSVRKKIGLVSSSFFDKHYSKEPILNIVLSGCTGTLGLANNISLNDVRTAKSLLTAMHLGDRMHHSFDMLSKGERQTVLIARALIAKPEILILDEPCTGLDVYWRSYLFDTVKQLVATMPITIIQVTHYVDEIIPIFKNALFMKNGRIFREGSVEELFTAQNLSSLLGYSVECEQDTTGMYHMDLKVESDIINILKDGEMNNGAFK